MHTTNYVNAFIQVAPDCPAAKAAVPAPRGATKSAAMLEYELLTGKPYGYTGDELLFTVHLLRNGLPENPGARRRKEVWDELFTKPHACIRASPLTKRYGWGVHCDRDGKMRLVPRESAEYRQLSRDASLQQFVALRNTRAPKA